MRSFALAVGLGLGLFGAWEHWRPGPSEQDLELITAPAENVTVKEQRNSRTTGELLAFSVAGTRVAYGTGQPNFDRLLSAVKSGSPISVGIAREPRWPFDRQRRAKVFSIATGTEPIVTFAQTRATDTAGATAALTLGGSLFVVALGSLWWSRRRTGKPV